METSSIPAARQGYRRRCLSDIWLEVAVDFDRTAPVDVVTDLDAFSDALERLADGRRVCARGSIARAALVPTRACWSRTAHWNSGPRSARRSVRRRQAEPAYRTQRVEVPGAVVSLDFSGRPGATISVLPAKELETGLPAGIVTAFFDSLARGARCAHRNRSAQRRPAGSDRRKLRRCRAGAAGGGRCRTAAAHAKAVSRR